MSSAQSWKTDLLVLDRSLIGTTMVATLHQAQRHFCRRVDASGWTCVKHFLRSGHAQRVVQLAAPSHADAATYELQRTPSTVRLIRDVTPGGTVRVLMTSLLDDTHFPPLPSKICTINAGGSRKRSNASSIVCGWRWRPV